MVDEGVHSSKAGNADRVVAWVKLADRLVLFLVAAPIAIITAVTVSGWRGPVLGFAFAMGVWLIYAGVRTLAVALGVRIVYHDKLSQTKDLDSIWKEAVRSDRPDRAVVELDELIAQQGESYDALLMLAAFLCESNELTRAESVIERVKEMAPDEDRYRIELCDVARLRKLGQHDAAFAATSRLKEEWPQNPQVNIEHARALAALGRLDEAKVELAEARKFVSSLLFILIFGYWPVRALRKDLREAEADVESHAAGAK